MTTSTLDGRAAAAFDPTRPAHERDPLLAGLLPELSAMALRLTGRDPALADDLVSHLLYQCAAGRYDPARPVFGAWARRVMANARYDHLRRAAAPLLDRLPDRSNRNAVVDARDLLSSPLGDADLAVVRRWTPGQQVVLLVRGLLWDKLPDRDRDTARRATRLAAGFPGPDYADLAPADRHAALAAALGLPANTLHQRWRRWRRMLGDLRFVRDLVGS